MESQGDLPSNKEEFEKAILKAPNNIEMWIQYTSWTYENEVIFQCCWEANYSKIASELITKLFLAYLSFFNFSFD